jgi:tetratricopeptide (TPR) repeat protein
MLKLETHINDADFIRDDTVALGVSLYREGRLDEARSQLAPLAAAGELEAVIQLGKVEWAAKRYAVALELLNTRRTAFASSEPRTRARFHLVLAGVYQDAELTDKAFIEYEEAIFHQESAREFYDAGCAANNLGYLLAKFGRFDGAAEYLKRARGHFKGMPVKLAEVDNTTAQILMLEKRFYEAEGYALEAVRVFREYDEPRLLAGARRTLALAVAGCDAKV